MQTRTIETLDFAGKQLLGVGVVMHLFGIAVDPGHMQAFAFVANVVLHLPSLWKNSEPQYGIDYTAYINQANQVANG